MGALALVLLILAGAIGLQFVRMRDASAGDQSSVRSTGWLQDKLPHDIPGWRGHDESLGPSEFVQGQVESVLNYDDYVFRIFERGSTRFGVYAAYWKKDRMPVSRVASHTPDRCWTDNGWECQGMRFDEKWSLGHSGELQPGQWRVFRSPAGGVEYVIFWHLVGGQVFDFGDRFTHFTHPMKWLRDTISYAALGSSEQYFIRLTSNRPFEEIQDDPGFQEILAALAK
jgi:hypothetical protein